MADGAGGRVTARKPARRARVAVAPTSPFLSAVEREEERTRKRDAVLQAAVVLFNARGFHATSLDDVAASLGITKPAIYRYFASKDQVLLECVKRGIEQLMAAAAEARERPASGLDRLRGFLCRYAEIAMADFGTCVIRTDDTALSAESAKQFRRLKRRMDGAIRGMVADGVADGTVSARDVRETTFVLAGALNWAAHWYRPEGEHGAPEVARRLVDVLIAGLRPR